MIKKFNQDEINKILNYQEYIESYKSLSKIKDEIEKILNNILNNFSKSLEEEGEINKFYIIDAKRSIKILLNWIENYE